MLNGCFKVLFGLVAGFIGSICLAWLLVAWIVGHYHLQ